MLKLLRPLQEKASTVLKCSKYCSSTSETAAVILPSPLEGIRVMDMTRILAGPYCTMVLGDLGAEIIKIEHPKAGDDTRSWGPPFLDGKSSRESTYFLSVNRNKKSICVDITKESGRQIIHELSQKSDVLVENYVPGKLSEYGLGYEDLALTSPHLIYCSITGFGSSGPYAQRPGYDVIAASLGGLMHITGPADGPPVKVGVALTDLCTGLYAHGAILAALMQRGPDRGRGRGQHIQCDLLSTQVATLANVGSNYLNGGQEAKRHGTAHMSIVPYQTFQTGDGWLTLGCGNEGQFRDFSSRIGKEGLAEDEKFSSNERRVKNRIELVDLITSILSTKTNEEWNGIFEGASFPYGAVNDFKSVFQDPQIVFNETVQKISHESLGTVKQVRPAVSYSGSRNEIRGPPPVLGSHTKEVLKDLLGMNEEEVERMEREKIIR